MHIRMYVVLSGLFLFPIALLLAGVFWSEGKIPSLFDLLSIGYAVASLLIVGAAAVFVDAHTIYRMSEKE